MALFGCCSCSTVRKSAQLVDVMPQVASYPAVADLHVSSERVSKTVSWKWNPFNTTSLATRKGNLKADIIREAQADILVEPEYVQHTTWGNLGGGSLTVSGYPAKLDNFRNATPEDIAAMETLGALYGKKQGSNGEVYILLDNQDVKGAVIGKVPSSAPENVTNAYGDVAMEAEGHASVTNPSQTSQSHASENSSKSAGASNIIAYDAIGKTRYLRTMAKDYYGNPEFWPYIYKENSYKLGDPDRIPPGTSIKIPSLAKYGVNPNNQADLETAKKLGREIYARYGK